MKKRIALFCATIILVAACILLISLIKPTDTIKPTAENISNINSDKTTDNTPEEVPENTIDNILESSANSSTEQSDQNSANGDGTPDSDDPGNIDSPGDTEAANANVISIVRHPMATDFGRGALAALPKYDASSDQGWQVDLRGYDLSGLDLSDRLYDLSFAEFDSRTIWPEKMPDSFKPEEIMEVSKNPGLNVHALHNRGIDGRGVGIAIIDQCLLTNHVEYKDQLRFYDEIHCFDDTAAMHGAAVSSIAVGKTVGVAPAADLYYIAETHGNFIDGEFEFDFTWLAKSVDRILEINETLPAEEKIRVISMSIGWSKSQKGYKEITESVKKARTAGIFVVSSSLEETFGLRFHGLGRDPLKSTDDYHSYEPGMWWKKTLFNNPKYLAAPTLLVPMDARTTASPTGTGDYVFYRQGGWSWSIPYIAGLYALACQVEPELTPDLFWEKALETGDTIKLENKGKKYDFGRIANPEKLIATFEK